MPDVYEDLPDSLMIEFKKPITFNGKTLEAITLEEPTIGQIEMAKKKTNSMVGESASFAFIREMIVLVAVVDTNFVSQMKISDVMKATAYIMAFIEPSLKGSPSETQ